MTYHYRDLRPSVFTPEGVKMVIKLVDYINKSKQDFFYLEDLLTPLTGDSWEQIACADFLVEIGRIREIDYAYPSGQKRLFTKV